MDVNLQVYCCYRYIPESDEAEDWIGAVLIAAKSLTSAVSIFREREDAAPKQVTEMEDVFAAGDERVIYNDYSR
jgi:hypothetical protein